MTRLTVVGLLALAAAGCGAPAEEGRATRPLIVEEHEGLWLIEENGARRLITAPIVANLAYDALAAKQVEGRVILYWAAAPVLSPRGDVVAYATNREAVDADTSGQSIWIADLESGRERALLHRTGRSFRPVGWMGDDVVVYIGDEPGVHGVERATGRTRLLAPGTFLAAADDGSALAVADGVPDHVRVRVLGPDGAVPVPAPPAGFAYLAQARFTDDGRHLLLEAQADSGRVRLPLVYDLAQRSVAIDRTTSRAAPGPSERGERGRRP